MTRNRLIWELITENKQKANSSCFTFYFGRYFLTQTYCRYRYIDLLIFYRIIWRQN